MAEHGAKLTAKGIAALMAVVQAYKPQSRSENRLCARVQDEVDQPENRQELPKCKACNRPADWTWKDATITLGVGDWKDVAEFAEKLLAEKAIPGGFAQGLEGVFRAQEEAAKIQESETEKAVGAAGRTRKGAS